MAFVLDHRRPTVAAYKRFALRYLNVARRARSGRNPALEAAYKALNDAHEAFDFGDEKHGHTLIEAAKVLVRVAARMRPLPSRN